jgi:hypothetical protein
MTGGENATSRGFEWGTQTGVYPSSWTENGSFGVEAYTHQVTGLTEDITIFYRAKATNSEGTGYGAEQTFKTWKGVLPTDSGAGVETPSLALAQTFTDSGIGAEGLPSIGLSFVDVGSGSESSLDLQYNIQPTDSGVGSETSLILAATLSVTDAGSGLDKSGFLWDAFDSGAGVDAVAELTATVPITDSGQGVETWSVQASFTIGEAGAGSEALGLSVAIPVSEAGSGTEIVTPEVAMLLSDAGSGVEVPTTTFEVTVIDAGVLTDTAALTAVIPISDSGIGAEGTLSLAISFTITDAGSGAEVETTASSFTVTDLGANMDAASITAAIPASDSLTGVEALSFTASIPATDSGAGVDVQITGASFTVADSGGLFSELVTVPGYPFITDSGVTVEVFSKQFDIFEEALAAEFAWRRKGPVLIDALELPHVLSIRVTDDAAIVDKKLQGGLLPRRKMIGKSGRVVEIVGWSDSQSEIDALEALVDGTARTFYHPSGDSFAVLVTGFNPDQSVDEYDRRAYRLSLVELRSW